jgi:adenine-specific DNA-methyltransferase
MKISDNFSEKELGAVFTPVKTAEYIISRLGKIEEGQKILDPCVGHGIFIKGLLKRGVQKKQIYAYDLDNRYRDNIEDVGINFTQIDSILSYNDEDKNKFDFIVGNPPYLNKSSKYIKMHRKDLKKIYGDINAHETYSMFIVNGIWRLKEGGTLGFITSDSFLTLTTHEKLRDFILQSCLINEITLAPNNLFDDQDVNTSPVIIILTKRTGTKNNKNRLNNEIRLVPRLQTEDDYYEPPLKHYVKQKKYFSLPFHIFHINVEDQIIKLFEKAPKLEAFLKGFIGMHTHNNKKYIAAIEGSELAEIFKKKNQKIKKTEDKYRIISYKEFKSEKWRPYLKRGGVDQYFRPIFEALYWDEEAIEIYDIPRNAPFQKEGIVISGVSSRLAARYMPEGCYWDSNKAIGFILKDKSASIEYILGLLNSSLYNYLAKGIINNTNSIQISGIHSLPYVIPSIELKSKVENIVRSIIAKKKLDQNYYYLMEQKEIDNEIFNFYSKEFRFPPALKEKLDSKYSIYTKRD